MKKLTFSELAAKGQFNLVVRRKHVRGNKCHVGDNCPAARAALDLVDTATLDPYRPVWAYPDEITFHGPQWDQSVKFTSLKLRRAINRYDQRDAKFPIGTYRLKRIW